MLKLRKLTASLLISTCLTASAFAQDARQSIPSNSIDNCAGVSATLPSFAEGQTNRPFSSRFMNMQAP